MSAETIEINLVEESRPEPEGRALPDFEPAAEAARPASSGGHRILIAPEALRKAFDHASEPEARSREVGGVLVGYPVEGSEGASGERECYVVIEDTIRALGAQEGTATIQFTPESWVAIYREFDEHHDGKQIVGWYHTHPGYSVFFSGVDRDSHIRYFRRPWQVALVIDPQATDPRTGRHPDYGFFRWRNGQFAKEEKVREHGRLKTGGSETGTVVTPVSEVVLPDGGAAEPPAPVIQVDADGQTAGAPPMAINVLPDPDVTVRPEEAQPLAAPPAPVSVEVSVELGETPPVRETPQVQVSVYQICVHFLQTPIPIDFWTKPIREWWSVRRHGTQPLTPMTNEREQGDHER